MEEGSKIITDGTYGTGNLTEVKVYTRLKDDPTQLREETFLVPYLFLDVGKIATMHAMNLFAGFSLVNEGKPSQLKELGL
jgi:hypothetical protein